MKTIKNNTKSFKGNLSILASVLMIVLLASAFSSAAISGKVIASSDGLEVSAGTDNTSVTGSVEVETSNGSTSSGGSGASSQVKFDADEHESLNVAGTSNSNRIRAVDFSNENGVETVNIEWYISGEWVPFPNGKSKIVGDVVNLPGMPGQMPITIKDIDYEGRSVVFTASEYVKLILQSKASGDTSKPETDSAVTISMYPVKQKVNYGESVEYVLAVRDNRMTKEISPRTYYLEFVTNNKEVFGSFSESKLTFEKSGDGKKVILTVTSTNIGSNEFKVYVKDSKGNLIEGVKGGLLVIKNNVVSVEPTLDNETTESTTSGETRTVPTVNSGAYFIGEGFMLGENESMGHTFKINLLKKYSDLRGNFFVKGSDIDGRIQGTFEDGKIEFTIVSKEGKTVGKFSGKVSKFNDFTLLRGEIKMSDGITYSLTATSHNQNVVRAIKVDKDLEVTVKTTTEIEEFVVLENNESISSNMSEEQYIQPVEVYTKKFLGIFPTNKKVLVVKAFSDGKETEIKINEYSEKKIGEYIVKVGNLDDKENIKLEVKASK